MGNTRQFDCFHILFDPRCIFLPSDVEVHDVVFPGDGDMSTWLRGVQYRSITTGLEEHARAYAHENVCCEGSCRMC